MKTYRKVALIFTLLLTAATNLSAATPQERDALVALYNSADGDNWYDNRNWNVGDPCTGFWYGVICDNDGGVTSLSLGSKNLRGFIPTEIGNLINLTYLNLSGNNLTGPIPTTIGNLTNLTYFHLEFNQLTGSIPPEIGNLTNLKHLYLSRNQLTGSIPLEIGNLTNLIYLFLSRNQLTGSIPPEIGNLINLTNLGLGDNLFTGSIPLEIGNLTNLTILYLATNYLSGEIPSTIMDTDLVDVYGLYLNTNCNLYSSNPDVQDFISDKSAGTYEDLLATQGNCQVPTLVPAIIMYLLN